MTGGSWEKQLPGLQEATPSDRTAIPATPVLRLPVQEAEICTVVCTLVRLGLGRQRDRPPEVSATLCAAVSTGAETPIEDFGGRRRVGKVAPGLREPWGWGGISSAELGLSPGF